MTQVPLALATDACHWATYPMVLPPGSAVRTGTEPLPPNKVLCRFPWRTSIEKSQIWSDLVQSKRKESISQPSYLQAEHLLGKPRAITEHNWELNVFHSGCPGDAAAVSVINKSINTHTHIGVS